MYAPQQILAAVQAGELHPMDALNTLVESGHVVLAQEPRSPELWEHQEWDLFADQLRRSRPAPRPQRQQVFYRGPRGQARVTFAEGQAIIGRLKPSGSFKTVATLPWVRGLGDEDFAVNAALQGICGPDFVLVED